MGGFGEGDFGEGPFGEWDWSKFTIVEGIPEIYKLQDQDIANGELSALLESLSPSFDYIREKIDDIGNLRDPLLCPVEESFLRPVSIIQVDDLGDGTSRVFLSQGSDGQKYKDLRIGQVLTDSSTTEFVIEEIISSGLPGDLTSPPVDPATSTTTGKYIIVKNISLGSLEVIPLVSGHFISNELPASTAPANDGSNKGPYVFSVIFDPIAGNRVRVTWQENGQNKVGYFNNDGKYFGDLTVGSSIDFLTGAVSVANASDLPIDGSSIAIYYTTAEAFKEDVSPVPIDDGANLGPYVFTVSSIPIVSHIVQLNWLESGVPKVGYFSTGGVASNDLDVASTINFTTGVISALPVSGLAVDADSLKVTYVPPSEIFPEDAEITAQHILAFLAQDYGASVDRADPETFQRSYLYNAYQLWDVKGTLLGYESLGAMSGFSVKAFPLYLIDNSFVASLPTAHVFQYVGEEIEKENPSESSGAISPAEDGSTLGPFTIQVLIFPIADSKNMFLTWKEGNATKTVTLTPGDTLEGDNVGNVSSWSVDRTTGISTVTFNAGHPPDAGSVLISYFPFRYFTDLDPIAPFFDDVVGDAIAADLYTFDADFPEVSQDVDVLSVVELKTEGYLARYRAVCSTLAYGSMHESFGTTGTLNLGLGQYIIDSYARVDATTFTLDILLTPNTVLTPAAATITWKVLKNTADVVTDNPGVTAGSSISPSVDGVNFGPFTIQLANFPLWDDPLTVSWKVATVSKTATITGVSTIGGPDAADVSATLNRTTGSLSLTFIGAATPDANSVRFIYSPKQDLVIVGVGTDIVSLGAQYFEFTGVRYKLTHTFVTPLALASVGFWKIIDANGVASWIEKCTLRSGTTYTYDIEFISNTVPAAGPANIYYTCDLAVSCVFCRASAIRIQIRAVDILNYPVNITDAFSRIITRMSEMIPAHVRISDFMLINGNTITEVINNVGSGGGGGA